MRVVVLEIELERTDVKLSLYPPFPPIVLVPGTADDFQGGPMVVRMFPLKKVATPEGSPSGDGKFAIPRGNNHWQDCQ